MTVFQQARRWIYTQVSVVWTCQGSGLFPTASPGSFLPFCLLFLTYDRVNCGDWANLFGGKPCNQVPRRKIQLISIINQITARRMWAGQPVAEVLGAFWLGCFCSVLFRPENVPVRSFHALIAAAPPFFLLWRPSFITVCLVVRQTATQTFPPPSRPGWNNPTETHVARSVTSNTGMQWRVNTLTISCWSLVVGEKTANPSHAGDI